MRPARRQHHQSVTQGFDRIRALDRAQQRAEDIHQAGAAHSIPAMARRTGVRVFN
jgi:hypothetical protein